MKKSVLFLMAFFTLSTAGAYAQGIDVIEFRKCDHKYGFVSVGGGALIYYGDYTSERKFEDRLSANIDVSLGMWFNPNLGARLQWSGYEGRSTAPAGMGFGGLTVGDGFSKNDFNLNYTHVDLLWNLSNTIGGFRTDRFWEFVPYVGVGWANASKMGHSPSNRLGINAGLMQKVYLSPSFDIILDVRAMGTNRNFDKVVRANDGHDFDMTASASLGLVYNFGQARKALAVAEPIDMTAYNARINALEREIAANEGRTGALAREVEALRNRKPETTVIHTTPAPATEMAIFFEIGKADLSQKELVNISYIADVIKKAPNTNYVIYGSADKETGTAEINQRLSEQRAKVVYDALIKDGVRASQLKMVPQGDRNNRFETAALNRVVIVVNE